MRDFIAVRVGLVVVVVVVGQYRIAKLSVAFVFFYSRHWLSVRFPGFQLKEDLKFGYKSRGNIQKRVLYIFTTRKLFHSFLSCFMQYVV